MLDFQDVLTQHIPVASAGDLRRFWSLLSQHASESGVSYSARAISQLCESESADPIVVWARTTLIEVLRQQGMLDAWQKDGVLHEAVFEAAASFPLPNGLQGVDGKQFAARLAT